MATEPMLPKVSEPAGWDRPSQRQRVRVRFTDGNWQDAVVLGWRHRDDQWYAHLQWPSGHSDWRRYDTKHLRPE